jgi:hypothetical protein
MSGCLQRMLPAASIRGMVGRPSRRRRRRSRKPQGGKVERVDENLGHPNRVLVADVILRAVREQRLLHPNVL